MCPRIEDVTEKLGEETKVSASEQYEIAALLEALEYIVNQVNELQRSMKNAKKLGRKIKRQEKKKTKLLAGEGKEVMESLTLLHEGNLSKFSNIMSSIGKSTGAKKELNEREIVELREVINAVMQFRNSIISLVEYTSVVLESMKKLSRLLDIDESDIIKQQTALQSF